MDLGVRIRGGLLGPVGDAKCLSALSLYRQKNCDSFRVGLKCSLYMQTTWHLEKYWIKARERVRVDLVHFGPPYLDHTHVTNA